MVSGAIAEHRLLAIEYYKENEDEFTERTDRALQADERPGGLVRARWDLDKDDTRSFRLDRIRSATVLDESFEPRAGHRARHARLAAHRRGADSRLARVWISPERARWAREDKRVVEELADGAVVVELPYAGHRWLAREVLKEAGDAVVLEPEDARQAVLEAAEALAGAVSVAA